MQLHSLFDALAEGVVQQLSVQQLATISDAALDQAYGYGRSTPGNSFGWQANLKSAAYAKRMIDAGVTDVEKISDAIHQGWNTTARAFVQNPDQFGDTEKLRAAGKLDAKLAQREKLMNIGYSQLPNDEQEKDRVVARALLQALTGQQGVAEGVDIGKEWMSDTELDQYVPDRLQQQWRELLGYDRDGNPSALWANLTGGYEPDVNDPQHRALMVKVANKWFAAKKIHNVKFFNVKDADDELEWLVQIGQQGVAEEWSKKYKSSINCSHPKGFSQKAHCAGKKKHNESIEMEMTCPDCGMCQTHGDHSKDKLDELKCWSGFHRVAGTKAGFPGSCAKNKTNEEGVAEDLSRRGFLGAAGAMAAGAAGVGIGLGAASAFDEPIKIDGHFYRKLQSFAVTPERLQTAQLKNTPEGEVYTWVIQDRRHPGSFYYYYFPKEQDVKEETCPHCNGPMFSEMLMMEKKDACYYKVKSRYKVWPSAYASGALVKCRKRGASNWGNKSESVEPLDENLHDWFHKEKWVRMDTKGNIKGPCAREPGEGKPKCLPQAKAHALGKKGRASAAARKRRQDPNPERSGSAINVATKEAFNPKQAAIAIAKRESGKYSKEGKRLKEADNNKCPPATQDITLNLKNRQKAIDDYGYGPLNPDLPNTKFWMAKVEEWKLDSAEEAKSSLCGNCAAFDQRADTLDCIAQGIGSDQGADDPTIDAGDLGYCRFLKFKCASRRTCDAWVTGGPLTDTDKQDVKETRAYYNVIGTSDALLRSEFGMRKDPNGWFLSENIDQRKHLAAYRAFGAPKLKEYNLAAFSGSANIQGDDNIISPVGSGRKGK